MTDTRTPNLLIVGADDQAQHRVRRSLGATDCRCTYVSDALEAVWAAQEVPMDAVLVDVSSFGADDGLRLARRMRQELADLPLVLLAESSSPNVAMEAMHMGAADYLRLPFSGDELAEAVDRAVSWRREAMQGRDTVDRRAREVGSRAAALVQTCTESGIGTAAALDVWMSVIYRHDRWTLDHVRRVAHLSQLIGTMMDLGAPLLGCLWRAALLHDIGKLAIPDELVSKPGPLTTDERALVRAHVQIGHDIASATPFLEPAAETVLAIREQFGGGGYPRGLRGEEIPIGARIIAVAEAFDAIAAARSTPDPVSTDVANATMVRGAGSRFDPAVVNAWLRCADSGVFGASGDEGGSCR